MRVKEDSEKASLQLKTNKQTKNTTNNNQKT